MKFRMYFIGLVLGVVLFGCGETRDVGKDQASNSKKEKSSIIVDNAKRVEDSTKQAHAMIINKDSIRKANWIVDFIKDEKIPFNPILKFKGENVKQENKILSVRDINPYKDLLYGKRQWGSQKVELYYDFRNISTEERETLLSGMRINRDAQIDSNYLVAQVKIPIVIPSNDMVAISYEIIYNANRNDRNDVLGTQGIVIIYDEMGIEIQRIEDRKDGFNQIKISGNGKYLAQEYGFLYGEGGSGSLECGLKVYEIKTGKLLKELNFGEYWQGYFGFLTDHFFVYWKYKNNDLEFYIIDLTNDETYLKILDRNKYMSDSQYSDHQLDNFMLSKDVKDLMLDGFNRYNN